MAGTQGYMSPEVITQNDKDQIGTKMDIWYNHLNL